MKIESSAFGHKEPIPSKYTCEGEDSNPPLEIKNIPEGCKSLALIIDDPDAPGGSWIHWLVWNISPSSPNIEENSKPEGAIEGRNSFNKTSYGGPCPPGGTHNYWFKVYALDEKMEMGPESDEKDLQKAMEGHVIEKAELAGTYSR